MSHPDPSPGRCPCNGPAPEDGGVGSAPRDLPRVPLSALTAGGSAVLCHVGNGAEVSDRLADLGFVPGTRVRVVRLAPLGDPIELCLRGTHFCLRSDEADTIWVHPARGRP